MTLPVFTDNLHIRNLFVFAIYLYLQLICIFVLYLIFPICQGV